MSRLRVAVVSTFFPNASTPYRTLFVRHLVSAMTKHADVRVIAPLAYAPPWPKRARWQALRSVPATEVQGELQVEHPRYLVIPKLWSLSGLTYARAVEPALARLVRDHAVDIVHVHCAYPDAVGVEKVTRKLGLPFVVTAHGSDINVYSKHGSLTGKIRSALEHASAVIAVSEDLSAKIQKLVPGIDDRLSCIPCCGVNPAVFHVDASTRGVLGPRTVLFVGNLVHIKGVDTLLEAWRKLVAQGVIREGDRLLLVGAGPLRDQLQQSAADLKSSVEFLGARPQSDIAALMRTATALCLSSRNEGMPNVVVEALASGLPVAATAVGGVPELVRPGVNGELASPAEASELAGALVRVFEKKWDADQIASSVSGYNWDNLAARNLDVLSRALRLAKTR